MSANAGRRGRSRARSRADAAPEPRAGTSSSVMAQGQMSASHRMFLQHMMVHKSLDSATVAKVHMKCCQLAEEFYARDQLGAFIDVINTHIRPLFMDIQKGASEDDGILHYALINIEQNEVTLLASDYSAVELELFNKIMEIIVDSGVGMASSTNILNLVDQLKCKKMKKVDAEVLLKRLVQDKWLCVSHGYFSLSPRCLIEMDPFIRSHFSDVQSCHLCDRIALKGQVCSDCGLKIHIPCSAKFFKGNKSPMCPHCSVPWVNDPPETESRSCSSSAAMEL